MKGFVISLATAAFVVAGVYLIHEADQSGGVAPRAAMTAAEPAELAPNAPDAGGSLRDQLLHSKPQRLGITPIRGVWGVLMERGYAKGAATVVALADGTASMYLSTGASVVGGQAYAPARAAALKLCERAADSLADAVPTHDFPRPGKGHVLFYVLADDGGVRVIEADILSPARDGGNASVGPWLAAGDALLEALKQATSRGFIR